MSALYGYQQTGAEWLAGRKHALLADEMGLGKSAQAIAACRAADARHVLVVCPASVVENWRREFARFWPGFGRFGVISYDKAVRGVFTMLGERVDLAPPGATLILDEAHYLKSHTAKRTKAIFGEKCDGVGGLVERADRVILLSGTPMPNHPAELWPALRALWPEQITGTSGKPYAYWQFVSKFCKTKDNGFGIQIVGAKNHDLLREKLEPVMLRRLKADVLPDLPEITFDPLFVEGSVGIAGPEADLVREALEAHGVEGLKRIAPHVATLRRLTGMAKVEPVVEWVKEWLDGCDRKIVLFAHHREVIAELFNTIGTADAVVVAGSTSDRQAAVDEFQNDPACRVFIGQNTAAGTGITLTAASDLLLVEPSWVPSDNAQIAGRIHRISQGRGCQVRFVTLAGSIDEQIGKALARKAADISAILDEPNVGN